MHPNRRPAPGSHVRAAAALLFGLLPWAAVGTARADGTGDAAVATASPPAHVIETVHAWRDFVRFARDASAVSEPAEQRAFAERVYLGGEGGWTRSYFAARGGGDASIAFGDWTSLPPAAFASVTQALGDTAVQRALERDAAELSRRFAPYGPAGDTTVFIFLVGDFSSPYTTWNAGRTQVVAVQLETFVPADFDAETKEAVHLAVVVRPDSLPSLAEVAPWAAYAVTRRFLPELRERVGAESASLAEYTLLHGFSSRFAAALYPQSVFGRGVGALRAESAQLLDRLWQQIGASWFPHGTKSYSAARYEEGIESKLPAGTTLDQAVTLVGARMAQEWLKATRIGRVADEPGQISRQGRVPTLSAWELLAP